MLSVQDVKEPTDKHKLDPGPTFYQWWRLKDSRVAVLEGSDAARIEEQLKNIAHDPQPILDHNLYLERLHRGATLHCHV